MRTVDAAITAGEIGDPRLDTHTLVAKNELLKFAAFTTQVNADLDTGVPQTYLVDANAVATIATWRLTNGKAYMQPTLNASVVGNWALSTSGATQLSGAGAATEFRTMRYGIAEYTGGPGEFVYMAEHGAGGVDICRAAHDAWFAVAFTASFGPAASDTSTNVTRVEAVCPVGTLGACIVAVGTHRFDLDLSTIQFWYVAQGGTVTQLQTIIQMPLGETYSAWYSNAKYACFISAIADAAGTIHVFANAHPDGKTVHFSIRNGVESMVEPVVPVNPTYGSVSFLASSVAKVQSGDVPIGHVGLYYLCGRMTYRWDDGTSTAFDCYLTSSDCVHWSIGERSYYLHDGNSAGTLLVDTSVDPDVVYYGGNLIVSKATLTPAQGYNTSDATQVLSLTSRIMDGLSLSQVSNAAHQLGVTLNNGDGVLTPSTGSGCELLKGGVLLYFESGQNNTNAAVGVYDIDTPVIGKKQAVNLPVQVSARDRANKAILRYKAPVVVDWWGQDAIETDLSSLDGLVLKTRADDVLQLESASPGADVTLFDHTLASAGSANAGLRSKALNNPLIAYADLAQANDGLMKARVTFPDTGDAHALQEFMFTFHGDDAGDFAGIILASDSAWEAKAKPRVVKSNLRPYAPATDSGGFEMEKRYQGLWESNNVAGDAYLQAVSEATSHYTTDAAFEAVVGTEYDFACRVSGRRVQLYKKLRVYTVAGASAAAAYVLTQEYIWDTDHWMAPDRKLRPGFGLNTDVWASKTAFAHAAYADYELGLTSARAHTSAGDLAVYFATAGLPSGVDHWARVNANRIQCLTSGNAEVNIDLRKYFYVGQQIRVAGGAQDRTYSIASIDLQPTYYSSLLLDLDPAVGNQTVYLRSGGSWAEAGSGAAQEATSGGNLWIDPRPVKATQVITGWGAFVGNDPTAAVYYPCWVDSDGVTHFLLDRGWDVTTNPIAAPMNWKLVLHHNVIGKWRASTIEGLATSGHFIVEQEAMRYLEASYEPWANELGNGTDTPVAPVAWMTYVPTYYGYPQSQTVAGTRIFNQAINGTDDFNVITNAAGLLVEITGRAAGSADKDVPNVLATGVGQDGSSRGYVDIDTMPAGPILNTDFVTLSGRGQFGTKKMTHPSDAAVCLYPSPIGGSAITSLVNVAHYDAYTGRYRSVEDALKYLCGLAGVRSVSFRNLMTGASASSATALTLTGTPVALPLVENLSDFEIVAEAHISSSEWLRIDFRGYYRLALKQTSTGVVTVGVQTTGTAIDADGDGLRWFEKVAIPVSASDIGSSATVNCELRVAMVGERLTVELNGAPLWTFNMALWMHTDGTSYSVRTAGAINVSYSGTVASNATTWRVPELWMPVKSISLGQGDGVQQVIGKICDDYFVKSRATAAGGIAFASFVTRDTCATMTEWVTLHQESSDDGAVTPHVQANGEHSGAYLDTARIATDGYSFDVISQDDAATVQQAAVAARLEVREAVEFAVDDSLSALGRVAHEVEDVLPVNYAVAVSPTNYVITSIGWKTKSGYVFAEYSLREYQSWLDEVVGADAGALWFNYASQSGLIKVIL